MTLTVQGEKEYPVHIQSGALRHLGRLLTEETPLRWFVAADENVAPLYGEKALSSLEEAGLRGELVTIPAGEAHKTPETYENLCRELVLRDISRSDGIIALGGGVTGDVAGFAAATLLRGVHLVQVPTTLLAQVDSALGGKVGIDLPEGKNLLGAFYAPDMVVVDPELLGTLPRRQISSGMAEVIKYGMIADVEILQMAAAEKVDFERLIARCLAIKAQIVEQDERDLGERHVLNFGHTYGHVYEAAGGYEQYTHGEAVAAGMMEMLRWQMRHGVSGEGLLDTLEPLLKRYELPIEIPCDKDTMRQYLSRDKKAAGGRIRIVTVPETGTAELRGVSRSELLEVAR